MCSQCHSDPAFLARHNLPSVVSSYLDTYHGKAVLFGSQRAPDCLDCHVTRGNVHEMRGKEDSLSSVHVQSRAQTCGSTDCHPSATPRLASFNPHVTHDPSRNPLEFSITLAFAVLTLGVLLPMIMLSVFGLLRELFPSREAEEEVERLTRIAKEEASRNNGILRFTVSQRALHVVLISSFATLALTGLPMKFPESSWAEFVYDLFGGIEVGPIVHRIAAMVMIAGFLFHITTVLRNIHHVIRRSGQRGMKSWVSAVRALPMTPNLKDLRDFVAYAKYVLFISPKKPSYGRFSWKEKFDYLAIFWGLPVFLISGLQLQRLPWGLGRC